MMNKVLVIINATLFLLFLCFPSLALNSGACYIEFREAGASEIRCEVLSFKECSELVDRLMKEYNMKSRSFLWDAGKNCQEKVINTLLRI